MGLLYVCARYINNDSLSYHDGDVTIQALAHQKPPMASHSWAGVNLDIDSRDGQMMGFRK